MRKNRLEIFFALLAVLIFTIGNYILEYRDLSLALVLGFGFSIYALSYQKRPEISSFCLGLFPLLASLLGYHFEVLLFLPLLCINDRFYQNKAWLIAFFICLFMPVFSLGSEVEHMNKLLILGPALSILVLRYTQSKNERLFLETLCVLPLVFLTGDIQADLSLQLVFGFLILLGILNRQPSFFILASILLSQSFIDLSTPIKLALLLTGISGVFGSIIFLSSIFLFAQANIYYPIAAGITCIVVISRVLEERQGNFLDRAWVFALPSLIYALLNLELQMSIEVLICLVLGVICIIALEFTRHLFCEKIYSTKTAFKELEVSKESVELKPELETNWNNNLAPTSSRFIRYYEYGLGVISTGFVLLWFYFN